MLCYLCRSDQNTIIHRGVKGAADINVIKCDNCGLVYLDRTKFSDIDDFYAKSGMRLQTNEYEMNRIRNIGVFDDERRFNWIKSHLINKTVLDFGCGAGGFLVRAKKNASSVAGVELESSIRNALISEGFQCFASIDDLNSVTPPPDSTTLHFFMF